MHNKSKTVFVGLSGGVDSSVTAALLQKAGHTVVGVFIRTWQPDFIECNFKEDRLDAMRVAAHLGIPFLECDAEEAYKKSVADYMIEEYRQGRTPNPDVFCNREIKFGIFWKFAQEHGADAIATGHYARNEVGLLKKAVDPTKDQVYFLWTLNKTDLEHVLFPLGGLHKKEVRVLADTFGLPTAHKKDSQGVCMLGDLDLKEFLAHYIPPQKGDVLDEAGVVIGWHDGATFLTVGERHGFTITQKTPTDQRYYIVAKDIEKNTIVVSSQQSVQTTNSFPTEIKIATCNWVTRMPEIGTHYTAQIRYHGEFLPCTISECTSDNATLVFEHPVLVAPGQSIVFYEREECIGGGIVS